MRTNTVSTARNRTTSGVVAVAIVAITFAAIVSGCSGEKQVRQQRSVTLFYEVLCCSCQESPEMTRIRFDAFALDRDFDHFTMMEHDIFTTTGFEALKETAERLGRDPLSIQAPALVVDEEVYLGEDAIIAELDRLHGR